MTPCKNCTDREIGCHSSCMKYIHYREDIDKEREAKLKERLLLNYSTYRRATPLIFKDTNRAKTKKVLYK